MTETHPTDPEVLLRETFSAHEPLVGEATAAGLAGAARARADRQRRARRRLQGAGVALFAVAAVTAGVLRPWAPTGGAPGPASAVSPATVTPTPTPTDLAPAIPAGWQRVSSLGVELAVPGEWKLNDDNGCHVVAGGTVTFGGGPVAGCGRTGPKRYTVVTIADDRAFDPKAGDVVTHPTVSGVPAVLRQFAVRDGVAMLSLQVPSAAVHVDLSGPDQVLLRRILATVRVVDVDSAGCHAVQPARPSWDRARPGPRLDPGSPDSVTVCLYTGQRLAGSTSLTGSRAGAVAAALRAATPGPVAMPPAADCVPTPEDSVLWLLLRQGERTTPVVVHYTGCVEHYATSPSGVSQPTMALLAATVARTQVSYLVTSRLPEN